RNRVHLAKLLRGGGNVLLLDEPTNDLDVDTLRALEEALLDFAGCAVIITHDRWFLDRVATHIVAFEGESQVTWFEGTWDEYADWVRETRGPATRRESSTSCSSGPERWAVRRRVERDRGRDRDAAVDRPVGVAGEVEDVLVAQLELPVHAAGDTAVDQELEVVRNRDPAAV